jgi:hypothetical protein
MKDIFGWILPDRTIIKCASYHHLDVVRKNPEMKELLPENLQDFQLKLDIVAEDCESLIAVGEHPEWHNYGMLESDFRYEIKNALHDAGALRFGSHSNIIVFEGKGFAIKNLMQKCEDYAEENSMRYEFKNLERK